MSLKSNEANARCLARKRGENVPLLKRGPSKGFKLTAEQLEKRIGRKQTPEQIKKRLRFGEEHFAWVGDEATIKTGRTRAERKYALEPCETCGEQNKRIDRHHKDGNTLNNERENIKFLCRKCHMAEDGRSKVFSAYCLEHIHTLQATAWKRKKEKTHCLHGHLFSPENTGRDPKGSRVCRACNRDAHRRQLEKELCVQQ